MKQRNSSFELLKVIAVVLIIFSSALPYGTTYQGGYDKVFVDLTNTSFTVEHMLVTLFRWFGQIGDTLFIACSAWFLCDRKTLRLERIGKMVADSWLLSVLGLLIAFAFMKPSNAEILKSFFPITFQLNWFVGCYILYYLLHPLLNRAIEGLARITFRRMLILLVSAYSVVSTVYPVFYFTNLIAFVMIHCLVSYIKKYRLFEHAAKYDILGILTGSGLILCFVVVMSLLGEHLPFVHPRNLILCKYYNPAVLLISCGAICLAAKKAFVSPAINRVSSWSLLIYLFHSNHFWITYGKYYFYNWLTDTLMCWIIPCIFAMIIVYSVAMPALSIVYEKTLGKLTGAFAQKMITRYYNTISLSK